MAFLPQKYQTEKKQTKNGQNTTSQIVISVKGENNDKNIDFGLCME